MRAVVPTSSTLNLNTFKEITIARPEPQPNDLLVEICAVSVNPVDYKVRTSLKNAAQQRILGWDAAGRVVAKGNQVHDFAIGDEVWYAGDLQRPGSNAEFQLVDASLAAKKPQHWGFAEAAAMPLTAITAWETLFEQLNIDKEAKGTLLLIGGAGGVGSIAIQLASQLTNLEVIATASREESISWCKKLGADHVVNHHHLLEALREGYLNKIDYIFCANDTWAHWKTMSELIKPFGRICSIVESPKSLDLELLKAKSAHFMWEFMFTRSMFHTADMAQQGSILANVAQLADQGLIKQTVTKTLHGLTANNFYEAHQQLEQGKMIGKLVIEY